MVSMLPYLSSKQQFNNNGSNDNNNYNHQTAFPEINTSFFNSNHSSDSKSFSLPPLVSKPHPENNNSTNPCSMDRRPHLPQLKLTQPSSNVSLEKVFRILFGAEISDWPYSEDSLQKALELRISQEHTKQEYYKVERMNRVIETMKLAAISKVPGHMIPTLFDAKVNETSSVPLYKTPSTFSSSSSSNHDSFPISPPTSAAPSVAASPSSPFSSPIRPSVYRHARGRTISNLSDLRDDNDIENTTSNNSNPMKSFKFGAGSGYKNNSLMTSHIQKKRTTLPPKHQLSPSRIGAHAISSLHRHGGNRLSVDLSNLRHGSNHNRTLSLPVSVSIPEKEQMNFHSDSYSRPNRNNNFKEIVIPDLSVKSRLVLASYEDQEEETEDVEKLLNGSSQYIRKHIKQISGSPLKEMTLIEENSENATITETDDDDSIVDFSISNISGFCSSSPNKTRDIEPKTP